MSASIPEGSPTHHIRASLLALLAACGWASGGLMSKWMGIPSELLAGTRACTATLILGLGLLLFRRRAFYLATPLRDMRFLIPFGIFGLAGMQYTYFKAIATSGVATAILLEYLAPVLTLIFSVIVYRQRLRLSSLIGVMLAVLGAALVVGLMSPGGLSISKTGLFWGLASAVGFACYSLMGAVGNRRFEPFTLLFYGLLAAAVFWLILLGPAAIIQTFANWHVALQLCVMAGCATVAPFALYLMALRDIDPTDAGVAAMIEPVLAAVGGVVLFAEPFSWMLVAGGALIIAAVLLIQVSSRTPKSS